MRYVSICFLLMHNKEYTIPILPPYTVATHQGEKNTELGLPLTCTWPQRTVFTEQLRAVTHKIICTEALLEQKIMHIIKQRYPDKMLISAAYLIGYEQNKIVYLDVRNYWFIAFPGWKENTSELAELIDMRQWSLSSNFWSETNICNIRQTIREMRVWSSQKRYVAFRHWLSGIDLTNKWLPGDTEVKKILWFDTSEVQSFLRKSFPDASPAERLDLVLKYTPETYRETLSREYTEETGRRIESASVYAVLLEEKSPHLLKVRFCYTGNVSEEKWWRMKHTTKEQQADMRVDTIWSKKLGPLMQEKLLQKVDYKRWYAWKEAFQFKKTSTALWHYLAFLVYTALQETKTK